MSVGQSSSQPHDRDDPQSLCPKTGHWPFLVFYFAHTVLFPSTQIQFEIRMDLPGYQSLISPKHFGNDPDLPLYLLSSLFDNRCPPHAAMMDRSILLDTTIKWIVVIWST